MSEDEETPIDSLLRVVHDARVKATFWVRGFVVDPGTYHHLMLLASLAQRERDIQDMRRHAYRPIPALDEPVSSRDTLVGIPVRVANPPDPGHGEVVLTWRMPVTSAHPQRHQVRSVVGQLVGDVRRTPANGA